MKLLSKKVAEIVKTIQSYSINIYLETQKILISFSFPKVL